MKLHPMMGFTPDGTPLGTVYAEAWTRDEITLPKAEGLARYKRTPIEDKESIRWLNAYREVARWSDWASDTQMICVAGSEADVYELLQETQDGPGKPDWIIRSCHDRALAKDDSDNDRDSQRILGRLLKTPILTTDTIHVRGRTASVECTTNTRQQPRKSRQTKVAIRATSLPLRAPYRYDRKLGNISVNAVIVTEIDPPEDDTPVQWCLLTSPPIGEVEEVRLVIQYYMIRWMIELFFMTLKSGCRVEQRRLELLERMHPCLAVYMIVAWRTLYIYRVAREEPGTSCEVVFDTTEWKSLYCVVNKSAPPGEPPTLREAVRMVASLGGYVSRRTTDAEGEPIPGSEPGPKTIWLGLQRLRDIAACWLAFGPESGFV